MAKRNRKPRQNQQNQSSPKSISVEADRRINEVYGQLLSQWTRQEILQYGATEWGLQARQIDTYISEAKQLIRAEMEGSRSEILAEHLLIRKQLYRSALERKDHAVCASIAKDQATLIGLYFTTEDHIRVLLALGYEVYEPDSPESKAANSEAEATGHTAVIVETASVTDDGASESETV